MDLQVEARISRLLDQIESPNCSERRAQRLRVQVEFLLIQQER